MAAGRSEYILIEWVAIARYFTPFLSVGKRNANYAKWLAQQAARGLCGIDIYTAARWLVTSIHQSGQAAKPKRHVGARFIGRFRCKLSPDESGSYPKKAAKLPK